MRLKRDFLFFGLPCVHVIGNYVVYSPYVKKAFVFPDKNNIDKVKIKIEKTYGADFFGDPLFKSRNKSYRKLTLITTRDCNLACTYCSVKAGEKKDFMDLSLAIRAIDEIITPEVKKIKVLFFGGEPTLNFKCIRDTVEYVKKKNIAYGFAISTNGIISDKVIDFLCENNFIIQVSADGLPKTQNYQRPLPNGGGSSDVVEKTIKRLVQKKATFKIRQTITNINVKKMSESVTYYKKLGVKYIFFEPLVSAGRAIGHKKIKSPAPNTFVKEFNRALNTAEKEGVQISNSLLINLLNPSTHYCSAALGDTLTITPRGLVTACSTIQDECNDELSNIMTIGRYDKERDKFDYNLKNIQHLEVHNVEHIKKCSDCFAKYVCSGGCIIRNLVKSGALERTNDEYCKIRKGLLKLIILKMSGLKK